MTAVFDLHSFWRTSATYRVRVALNLKGIVASEKNVNVDAGELRSPDYLAINPMAAIPAMIDRREGQSTLPLTQSLAILEFLEESYPQPALLPATPHARARVRSLSMLLVADTHPLITPRVKKYLMGSAGFDDTAWRSWQTQWFSTGLQAFEERLRSEAQTGHYCHGNTVTMADICLASIVVVMRVFKIEVPNTPLVNTIMMRCEALPEFAKAEPTIQVGAPAK